MKIVKVELTIEKSDWLEEDTLLRGIKDSLIWRLALAGSTLIDAKIKEPRPQQSCGQE